MRLNCPNCSAQYEVPDEVIPDEGRDVQCSSCGHTWYQLHPAQEAAIEATRADHGLARADTPEAVASKAPPAPKAAGPVAVPDPYDRPDTRPDEGLADPVTDFHDDDDDGFGSAAQTSPPPPPAPQGGVNSAVSSLRDTTRPAPEPVQPAPSRPTAPRTPDRQATPRPTMRQAESDVPEARMIEITDDDEDDYGFSFDDDFPADPSDKPRRELDPRVREVLKAEADREARVRAQERVGLESQPDLGLDEPETASAGRRRRESDMAAGVAATGVAAAATAAAASASTSTTGPSRRDMLPNIDEINSTLRSTSDRRAGLDEEPTFEEVEEVERKRSFSRGFRWALLLVLILAALYIFGPRLMELVPATTSVVGPYIDLVDSGRVWLDARVGGMMGTLDQMSSEAPAE